jgi:hypothetical protein
MNAPAADPQGRQHSLSDWLTLHELDPATCRQVLDAIARHGMDAPAGYEIAGTAGQPLDLQTAWLRVVEAMRDFLPAQHDIIDDTFANTARILVERPGTSRRAVTLDNGPAAYPTILYSYRGAPAEHLVMAHEFGHALQIRASQGRSVPPIMREVCAFLGEGALLAHARDRHAAQYPGLARAWWQDSRRYLGVQAERLEAALAVPAAPYTYSWNYPLARYLAIRISGRCSRDWIWSVFSGQTSMRQVLQDVT